VLLDRARVLIGSAIKSYASSRGALAVQTKRKARARRRGAGRGIGKERIKRIGACDWKRRRTSRGVAAAAASVNRVD